MAIRIISSLSLQQGQAGFANFQPYELGVLYATFVGNQKAAIGCYIERLLVAGRPSEGAGRTPDHTLFGPCQCCARARGVETNQSMLGMGSDIKRTGHSKREVVGTQPPCRIFDSAGGAVGLDRHADQQPAS